ncbi:hypothetical protein [Pseudomonas putida]
MDRSDDADMTALEIKAYELFLATHVEPDNLQARESLANWVKQSPAHWQAFRALDRHLYEVALLLAHAQHDLARQQ